MGMSVREWTSSSVHYRHAPGAKVLNQTGFVVTYIADLPLGGRIREWGFQYR